MAPCPAPQGQSVRLCCYRCVRLSCRRLARQEGAKGSHALGVAVCRWAPSKFSHSCLSSGGEESLEDRFRLLILCLDNAEGQGNARQAQLLIQLGRAILVLLLAVSLDLFTAVFDFGQAQGRRRPLEEMTKPG